MTGRQMLTSNLSEDPDELTRMAGIYEKYGLLEEMTPWMNQVYAAKKSRIPDALHFLLNGDAKGAREILEKGGVHLSADPVPAYYEDTLEHVWRFSFLNGAQKDIDLKQLAIKFFPEGYYGLQTGIKKPN